MKSAAIRAKPAPPAGREARRVVAALKAHEAELRARGVTSLALFGSIARGEERVRSDVDILIEIDRSRQFSLVDLARLKRDLGALLGRPADVTLKDGLRPFLGSAILADCIAVF